jgi:hypothetical protein
MYKLFIVVSCMSLLMLISTVCVAETCQLGSHRVSFNLGEPAEMKVETPVNSPSTGEGWYGLNIILSSGGYGFIKVGQAAEALKADTITNLSDALNEYMTRLGIEGYQYTVISYKDSIALSTYTPAQLKTINGTTYNLSNVGYSLWYTPDANTMVVVESHTLSNATYAKLLDSLEITKMHEPYIGPTSSYAGPGLGAKPGFEDQNNVSGAILNEG